VLDASQFLKVSIRLKTCIIWISRVCSWLDRSLACPSTTTKRKHINARESYSMQNWTGFRTYDIHVGLATLFSCSNILKKAMYFFASLLYVAPPTHGIVVIHVDCLELVGVFPLIKLSVDPWAILAEGFSNTGNRFQAHILPCPSEVLVLQIKFSTLCLSPTHGLDFLQVKLS
jgi:hypothetical protein